MTLEEIDQLITTERAWQASLWNRSHAWGYGDCSSHAVEPMTKVAVLTEEVGEVARAVLEKDDAAVMRELVQIAAVCVAWLEAM